MVARSKHVELSTSLSKSRNLKERDCTHNINSIFCEISTLLSEGKNVKVGNFGIFKVSTVKEHVGRNPRTGEVVNVPEKKKVIFCPSKNMLELASETPIFDDHAEKENSTEGTGNKKLISEPALKTGRLRSSSNDTFDF